MENGWEMLLFGVNSLLVVAGVFEQWRKDRLLKKADKAKDAQDYQKAGELFQQCNVFHLAGEMYAQAGNDRQAKEMFRKTAEQVQQRAEGNEYTHKPNDFYFAGELYETVEDYQQSVEMYRRAGEQYRKDGEKLRQNGESIRCYNDRFRNAVKAYTKAGAIYYLLGEREPQNRTFQKAGEMYEKAGDLTQAEKMYRRSGDYRAICTMYHGTQQKIDTRELFGKERINHQNSFQLFQQQHGFSEKSVAQQQTLLQEFLQNNPENDVARFAAIKLALKNKQWQQAFEAIEQAQQKLFWKETESLLLLLRAQSYFSRAEGADIRLGLQDVESVMSRYQDVPLLPELLEIAAHIGNSEYVRNTGTQARFPREYEEVFTLLLKDIERRFYAAVAAGENEHNLFQVALQVWQLGYHDLSLTFIAELSKYAAQHITQNIELAQQVMASANEYWKRAQEQPDIAIYDMMAERLWKAVAAMLEHYFPLAQMTPQNIEQYYLLFKAYQALRELPKCEAVGLKILGVVGVAGYKDVRPIVDHLVTGGFEAQRWRQTGDGEQPQSPMTGKPEQFGQYQGIFYTKGGMGEIYKGTAPDGTLVAIKRIPPYALNGVRLERFLREIQVVRQLAHPHIVKLLDVNQEQGYYVMEWAERGTLETQLKQSKTLPPHHALHISVQIAQALDVIHQQNIIHRDIKPQNILLFPNNLAKLTDFGVAYIERAETLTGTGVQVGTLRYMSPEQYLAEEIDNKTDIFSLGLVLYEMLTGDIPFKNPKELCQKDIEEIDYIKTISLPEHILQVIIKCLRNNTNRRYTASELRTELERILAHV